MENRQPKSPEVLDSISENNGLSLITDRDKNIYSVGISTGGRAEIRMAKSLAARSIIATTIDIEGANFAKSQIGQSLLSDRIEVRIEDIAKPLPYKDAFFDFIYARLVLHYLPKHDLQHALKELYRVLRPMGNIYIVVRSISCVKRLNLRQYNAENGMTTYISQNGYSYSRFFHSEDSICNFLQEAGFCITHIKTYDEQLYSNFQRTELSNNIDTLIEIYASKPMNEASL